MKLKGLDVNKLYSIWERFKSKRRNQEFFSDEEKGYLTMLQREELLDILFSKLNVSEGK